MNNDEVIECALEVMEVIMKRKRVKLLIEVDLDPLEGAAHDGADWQRWLQGYIQGGAPHYHPDVRYIPDHYVLVNVDKIVHRPSGVTTLIESFGKEDIIRILNIMLEHDDEESFRVFKAIEAFREEQI